MLLIYNIGIQLYYLLVKVAALFNAKAGRWVNGRREQKVTSFPSGCIWFHFASLGEFEQGRPVLEQLRLIYPGEKFAITFFSPSGYEIRKNTPLADAVYYLPLDTAANALEFIEALQPRFAVFTKYEYWYHFFNQLHKRHIPVYLISGIFRPNQVFFKWYGGLHRSILNMVSRFFVQDESSCQLLQSIGITQVQVSGDTRFDRVWTNAQQPKPLPLIQAFKNNRSLFIGGSTWPQDEELLINLVHQHTDWKFIFAPHEIAEDKISQLLKLLPAAETLRFSAIESAIKPLSGYQILIIDNIGMLSALYPYAEVAYIGGGFGVGIHNTLEAAAFGLSVIFGPNYQKFREARELIGLQAGFSIQDADELNQTGSRLITNVQFRLQAGAKARQYVQEHTGATSVIVNYLQACHRL